VKNVFLEGWPEQQKAATDAAKMVEFFDGGALTVRSA
jgi:hypothetical protein